MLSCSKCAAECCQHVAVVIDAPKSKEDFDTIRWFVSHKNIIVYKDQEDDWLLEFKTRCKHLDVNRCTIYETRPEICREYDEKNCSVNGPGGVEKILFTEPEQVEEHVARRWRQKTNGAGSPEQRKKIRAKLPLHKPTKLHF